jgi:OOP family OmpA-OmpF porin
LGFRFDSHWAARFEVADMTIDPDHNNPFGIEEEGTSLGADVLYFLDNDVAYLFGGIRQQNLDQNYRGLMAGIGKHWALAERIKVITVVGALHDFGDGYNDYNVKLGVAYTFGGSPSSAGPKDSDNDGVVDSRDQCPMTPAGTVVDATGCRLGGDADNDGVPDDMDKCPDSKSNDKVDASGCVIFEEKELTVSLNVLFANDSAVVDNPNDAQLAESAEFLKRFVNTSAVIEGHTSAVGPREYNQGLSERRAKAVREVLIQQYGIDASRLSAVGYGETRLLDEANNAAAHRLNRRIEATVSATVKEPQQK